MLGFAVLDRADDDVVVWLVSQTADAFADNSNAVTFDGRQADTADRVTDMLTDRVVVLTPRTDPGDPLVAGREVPPVPIEALARVVDDERARLQDGFAAEQARRKSGKQARVKQPQWPAVVPPREAADAPHALREANKICAFWRCWLKLETIRSARNYLTADSAGADLPDRVLHAHEQSTSP